VSDPALDARYPADWPAWVRLRTRSGDLLRGETDQPKGDPDNPLTDAELAAKFADLTRSHHTDEQRAAIIDAVATLPGPGSLATLLQHL
jgi:2-methylcitrate dehydratase PrpD